MDLTESSAGLAPMAVDDDGYDVPEVIGCISSMVDYGCGVESHRLFLARCTALEMLCYRAYSMPESELAHTLPAFRAWWADRPEIEPLTFSSTSPPTSPKKLSGGYMNESKERTCLA